MGSKHHTTTKTTASVATTALPKWDAQTANRFTSLRSSLQHALIDSSTSLLPNNNNISTLEMVSNIQKSTPAHRVGNSSLQ